MAAVEPQNLPSPWPFSASLGRDRGRSGPGGPDALSLGALSQEERDLIRALSDFPLGGRERKGGRDELEEGRSGANGWEVMLCG